MADSSSPLEDLRGEIHSRLLKLFRPNQDDAGRFIPSGITKTVLHKNVLHRLYNCMSTQLEDLDLDESTFVARIKLRELHDLLAILIYSRGGLRDFKTFVAKFVAVADNSWPVKGKTGRNLQELPLLLSEVQEIFNNDVTADSFKNNQSYFCPVVLQKNKEVVYERPRPLPYISKTPLGEGSFGTVYAVEIAAGHFIDGRMSNYSNDLLVACKEYRFIPSSGDTSHEQERAVMLEILRTPMKHDNILENFGSLRMDDTYSLFMPLADCDLWDWMIKRSPSVPETMAEKAQVLGYAAWLASGLAFLHDELVTLESYAQSCYHLDIKPRNILVVTDPETGQVRWKLSDFNMSRVKGRARRPSNNQHQLRRAGTFSETVQHLNVNPLFREINPIEPSRADSTINRRGDGTYIAPEALIDFGGKVGAHSDTWSLGCVLAVVFSYLDGGAAAVLQFSDRRGEQAEDDRFFSQTAPKSTHKPPRLNAAVDRWLKELCMNARKRDQDSKLVGKSERATVKEMMDFLKERVLNIDPDKRVKAKKVHDKLKQTFHDYIELQDEIKRLQNVLPDLESPKKRTFFPRLLSSRRGQEVPKPAQADHCLNLGLSPGARSCHFSPNAAALAYVYDDELKVYSITEIAQTQDIDALIDLNGESKPKYGCWGAIALSNQHIIATTNRFMFEYYIYEVSDSSSQFGTFTRQKHCVITGPRISQLAISPDSTFVAFVIYNSVNEKRPGLLMVTTMEEVMSWKNSELLAEPRRDSNGSSSIQSASSNATTFPNTMRQPLPVCADDVLDLRFSKNNAIFIVLQPKQTPLRESYQTPIFAWSSRSLLNRTAKDAISFTIEHDGQTDTTAPLYTSLATQSCVLGCTVISQRKFLLTLAHDPIDDGRSRLQLTQNRIEGNPMVKVLLDETDRIFCFGTKQTTTPLWLFKVDSPNKRRKEIAVKPITELDGLTDKSKFTAAVLKLAGEQDSIVVATHDGRFFQIPLDNRDG